MNHECVLRFTVIILIITLIFTPLVSCDANANAERKPSKSIGFGDVDDSYGYNEVTHSKVDEIVPGGAASWKH
jgi:hypothetical protein